MKLYYTSVIIQDSENSKPWSCSMQDSCTTIKDAKEIILKAKDSALRIDGNGVTVITPNQFTVKAGQHIFTQGASESPTLPIFPNNICWECLARRAAQRGAFINKGDGL